VIARDGGSSNVWVKIRGLDDRVRVLGGGGGHLGAEGIWGWAVRGGVLGCCGKS